MSLRKGTIKGLWWGEGGLEFRYRLQVIPFKPWGHFLQRIKTRLTKTKARKYHRKLKTYWHSLIEKKETCMCVYRGRGETFTPFPVHFRNRSSLKIQIENNRIRKRLLLKKSVNTLPSSPQSPSSLRCRPLGLVTSRAWDAGFV